MSSPFKVALTMRVVNADGYDEPRDAVSHDWLALLQEQGLEPVLVPNVLQDPAAFVSQAGATALLLTNGEDVHPSRYGGDTSLPLTCSPERDETEYALLAWALRERIPVLAVCRGLQVVNAYFGGAIVSEIKTSVAGGLDHVATRHDLTITDPVTTRFLGQGQVDVNSYHRHGVTRATLANGLVPFAETADGMVEGFYRTDAPLLAVQWHPERPGPDNFCQKELAFHFLKKEPWW